jgi:hypothetical protein
MNKMNILTLIGISLIFIGGIGGVILAIGQARSSQDDKQEIISTTKSENHELRLQITELKEERVKLNSLLESRDIKINEQNLKIESLSNKLLEKSDYIEKYISGGNSFPYIDVNGIPDVGGGDAAITFSLVNSFDMPIYDITVEAWDYDKVLSKAFFSGTNNGKSIIKRDELANSKLFFCEKVLLPPNTVDIHPGTFTLKTYNIYIAIHTRNKTLIQKVVMIEHEGKFYSGYIILNYPDWKILKEHIYNSSSIIIQKEIKEKLNNIPNLMDNMIIN